VVTGLKSVQSYDWAEFLNTRLHSTGPHAPLGGVENGGWKLIYNDVRSDFWKATEGERKLIDLSYSIGLKVKEDGTIVDVGFGRPAQKAGVAPASKLIAVNNRQYTPTVLREAVQKTASTTEPLEILIKVGEFYEVHRIDYHGGERYPHLERDPANPDLLSAIIAPLVKH
jgi:predicted metalloprotease with PDZ domain